MREASPPELDVNAEGSEMSLNDEDGRAGAVRVVEVVK
jgi:hypothetical protein